MNIGYDAGRLQEDVLGMRSGTASDSEPGSGRNSIGE